MTDKLVPDEAVRAIQDSVRVETIPVPDGNYATREVFLPPAEPTAARLVINTLQGIVDYLISGQDGIKDVATVHIVSAQRVDVLSPLAGRYKQRDVYVQAKSEEILGRTFSFNQFYELEDINIALQSLFAETPERDAVLKLLAHIKDANVKTAQDDGTTQHVSVKMGIQLTDSAVVPNPVELVPFRTFREIEQPSSPFVLRLQSGREGCLPKAALFEADGGQWQLEAIQSIKAFLGKNLEGVPIIA